MTSFVQAEAVLGAPAALQFLMDRLNQVALAPGCTYSNVTANLPVNSPSTGQSVLANA